MLIPRKNGGRENYKTFTDKKKSMNANRFQQLILFALFPLCASCVQQQTTPKKNSEILTPSQIKEALTTAPDTTAGDNNSKPESSANSDHLVMEKSNEGLDEPKKLSIPEVGASESPRNDQIHDNFNNAIAVLQDPVKALADFPRDRRFQVDWVAALKQGHINPRADLEGKTQMATLDLDILMKNTQFMPWVKFPHIAHTQWLACENCHPKIFIPKENANPISMNKVLRGEYCGVCHDKVAFSLFICERCHSVPHAGSGPKWW